MSLLSSKCGWLVKRNEQHVWQKRWCCVVPHTFLYYFEASPEVKADEDGNYEGWSGGGINIKGNATVIVGPAFQNLDQEMLNMAVRDGYDEGGDGVTAGKSSFYASLPNIMGGGGGANANNTGGVGEDGEHVLSADWEGESSPMSIDGENKATYQFATSNLQPVGIIDLECYSAVNRSKMNPTVLELAGDSITNPDLRSFYFQSATVEDAELWTKALLSERHQSLKDETEAYKQVCDSFPLQLQACSEMIDAAEAKAADMEKEAYAVRSAAEEGRRKVVSAVREVLERQCWDSLDSSKRKKRDSLRGFEEHSLSGRSKSSRNGRSDDSVDSKQSASEKESSSLLDSVLDAQYAKLETNRAAFHKELEATLASPSAVATSNVVPPVQTLADYTSAIVASFADMRLQLRKYEKDLRQSVEQDQTQLQALKREIEARDATIAEADKKHDSIVSEMREDLETSQRQVEELSKQLEAQRMEFGMYQNSTKNKVSELQQHKKILKREVIELRKKIDECGSENTTVAHEYGKVKSSYQSVKERNATLERYIERLEKQVGVQQNMMEMMSQTGGASFVGKMVGPGATDSKDAVSLSGMSMGSQYCRMNSNNSVSMGANGGGVPSVSTPAKSRPLLPPDSSKQRSIQDVSPLPTPVVRREDDIVDVAVSEERDASTAYYRSETTTESESPVSDPVDSGPTISTKVKDLGGEAVADALSPQIVDPVMATRSADEKPLSPRSPITNEEPFNFQRSEHTKTPVQSNSAMIGESDLELPIKTDMPNFDKGEKVNDATPLDANTPLVANFPPTDPDLDEDDDMDDIKSRVSDITEDRTQRQIDDDLAERRKLLLAYVQKSSGGSSNMSLSASTQRQLETIENMIPTNATASSSRGSALPRLGSSEDLESHDGSGSSKLSVAERARLAADKPNMHRSSTPAFAMKRRDDSSVSSSNNGRSSSSVGGSSRGEKTLGRSGSFFSKVGRAVENALDNSVLGVKTLVSDDDDDDDASEGEAMSDVRSEASTTLQERIAKQRLKQVEFLKNRGIIDDESSLRGGAGGSSVGASPGQRQATPRRGVGRKW